MESSPSANPYVKLASRALPVIGLSWLLIPVIKSDYPGSLWAELTVGFFFGSMFGHTTLAAAWAVLGPGPLTVRLAGSLTWVFMLLVAASLYSLPLETVVVLGAFFFGQWLLLQFVLWPICMGLGLHLQHLSDQGDGSRRHRQFGIGQLIVFTAIVAVVLGIGRFTSLTERPHTAEQIGFFFILAVAAVLPTTPLVFAALRRRHVTRAILITLAATGLVTGIESLLLQVAAGRQYRREVFLLGINGATSAVILAVMATVRSSGFRLRRIGSQPSQ
jgi:hypothetical protein